METAAERVTQARELLGWSKTELAQALDVTPAAVAQWEAGTKEPTAENAAALARCLNIPLALLCKPKPIEISRCGPITFRSWKSAANRKNNRKAQRLTEMVAEVFFWLGERVAFPKVSLPEAQFPTQGSKDVEELASTVRRHWGLGDRPILRLGELLESKGIVLAKATFCDDRFDAFSCIINGRPFIFLGTDKQDRARSRMDAAHELGHLILHQPLTELELAESSIHDQVENEAKSFAGAFLLPKETFVKDVRGCRLESLLSLKTKWGVSVQGIVRRLYDLGVISKERYSELFRQMSQRRWRQPKGEPLDDQIPAMRGTLGKKALDILEGEGIINAWELPDALPLPIKILNEIFDRNANDWSPNEFKNIVSFSREHFSRESDSLRRES
jgi:Zn-dependent peptidase ImmA (M78 family)/DNA-binding XRE family transcriptional regulator